MEMRERLIQSAIRACSWLTDIAQIKHAKPADEPGNVRSRYDYDDYRGAIKGDYRAATRQWIDFGPIWHTGQAARALALASEVLGDPKLLEAAKFSAAFILRNQVADRADDDYGVILAYEDEPDLINSSAIMEAVPGLLELHRLTGEAKYLNASKGAIDWLVRKMYLPDEGLIRDVYLFAERRIKEEGFYGPIGRPLVEDAVFLIVGTLTGDEALRAIHFRVLERLLADEDPPGNWIRYGPCNAERGWFHARHAYWLGMPFIDGYLETKDSRYLQAAERAAEWYVHAQQADGGLFRVTYRDFRTDSFDHATSGIACAAKMWARLWTVTGEERWLAPLRKALEFCMQVQITEAEDPNLQGVIIENVLPPDGTDRSLIYIRDLGTIFFIQAACQVVKDDVPV